MSPSPASPASAAPSPSTRAARARRSQARLRFLLLTALSGGLVASAFACGDDAAPATAADAAPDTRLPDPDVYTPPVDASKPDTDAALPLGPNPFGLFVLGAYASAPSPPFPEAGLNDLAPQARNMLASELGVRYLRASLSTLPEAGADNGTEVLDLTDGGFKAIVTFVNRDKASASGTPPLADVPGFKQAVTDLLATTSIELAVVENEELDDSFYAGTPADYLVELDAFLEVAHAHGVKVANGGLGGLPLALLTWNDLYGRGLLAEADTFATATFTPAFTRGKNIVADLPNTAFPTTPILGNPANADVAKDFQDAQTLVAAYATRSLDYVNFHCFQAPAGSLAQMIDYLRRATKKSVITNETGNTDGDPTFVTRNLSALFAERLPYIVWFSGDRQPAVALHSALTPSSYALRPAGGAFKTFVHSQYP